MLVVIERRRIITMGRVENVEIFKDTEHLVKTINRLKESVQASTDKQKIILEKDELNLPDLKKYNEEAQVVVSTKRTYEAASAYKGMKQLSIILPQQLIQEEEWYVERMRRKSVFVDAQACILI